MSPHNVAPRCSTGVVYLRSKCSLKFHIFYICTKDGKVKCTYYTTPQTGGSFDMTEALIDKYFFLLDFATTKPLAATIMNELSHQNLLNGKIVCHKAV